MLILVLFLASCRSHKSTTSTNTVNTNTTTAESKKFNAIKNKYATQLAVSEKEITNQKLFLFIDEWYATPYKYGGLDKSGIDCSGFTSTLYNTVYNKKVARATKDLYASCSELNAGELKEGDLVFFKIEKADVSHVGVYLTNNKFVHASTKKGVIINDLNEAYYKKYFYKGGRLK